MAEIENRGWRGKCNHQLRIWGKPKLGRRPPRFGSANISLKIQRRKLFAKFCAAPNIASRMRPKFCQAQIFEVLGFLYSVHWHCAKHFFGSKRMTYNRNSVFQLLAEILTIINRLSNFENRSKKILWENIQRYSALFSTAKNFSDKCNVQVDGYMS